MTELLITDTRDGIATLTLNRPEALNAFNDALYRAVQQALADARDDPGVAVAVVTGAGRAFSAGQDLGEMADTTSREERLANGFGPFIETVEAFPKPLIAAVNGLAVGIGMTFLPHCDLVFVSEEAKLRVPFASLGVTAEAGSSLMLPMVMGRAAAAHALFTAAWVDADEAVRTGLAWRKTTAADLMPQAMAKAREIAAMPVASLVATKKLILDARLDAVRAARIREYAAFAQLAGGPANREAIAAFRERRPPNFKGLAT